MEFKLIRLDKLNFASPQLRKDLREGLEELKESIKSEGILFPILVRPLGRGEYAIIDGNRRVMVCQELRYPPSYPVPALVDKTTDLEALKTGMTGNLNRKNLSALEEAEVVNLMVKSYKVKQKELVASLGQTKGYISQLISVFSLPREVISALRAGKISVSHARILARYQEKPEFVLRLFKRTIKDGLSADDLESIARIMASKQKLKVTAFSPITEKLKDGSRVKFEPRRDSIRIEINFNPEGSIEQILGLLRKNIGKIRHLKSFTE